MELALALAGVLGALLIGAASPGPSFVLVARTSVALSRIDGLLAAVGMGVGGVVFTALVLLGLHVVLAGVPWLYMAFKLAGGLYLMYLAVRIWRGAREPIVIPTSENTARHPVLRSFWIGFFTQLSNPKTAVVYGSIFAALLPPDMPAAAVVALPVLVFLVETGWYTLVALVLSAESSRAAYLRAKTGVDRAASSVIGMLGLKLVIDARPTP